MNYIKTLSSIVLPFFVVFFMALFTESVSQAEENKVDKEAGIFYEIESAQVNRVEVLEKFLEKHDSPLAESADTFVVVADKYDLDYRLLPAISCLESGCGKRMIPETFNAWGWGIYGNNYIAFENFDNGIEEVAKGISEGYIEKGLDTPAKMAPVYTPPRPQYWLGGVRQYMGQMDEISNQLADSSL
jgi:hypothetical protein